MINGWKIVEQNTAGAKSVSKATEYARLLAMLDRDRIDVAIPDRVTGGWELKQLGYDIYIIEPAVVSEPNFIYLHERHLDLVPKIAQVVEQLKIDGTYDRLYTESVPDR